MSNLVSHAFITLNEVKEALEISGGDHDAKLNGYINRATDIIESYCRRRFLSTVHTDEIYSGDGSRYLSLRNFPVTSLASVAYRTGDFSSPSWDAVDTELFTLDTAAGNDSGVIYLDTGFHRGVENYRFTYTAGYALADVPNDLKEACIEIVSYLFNRRKSTPGIKSETLGRYSYTLGSAPSGGMGILKLLGVDDILDTYRTPTV